MLLWMFTWFAIIISANRIKPFFYKTWTGTKFKTLLKGSPGNPREWHNPATSDLFLMNHCLAVQLQLLFNWHWYIRPGSFRYVIKQYQRPFFYLLNVSFLIIIARYIFFKCLELLFGSFYSLWLYKITDSHRVLVTIFSCLYNSVGLLVLNGLSAFSELPLNLIC